jgi:hypothetical protein
VKCFQCAQPIVALPEGDPGRDSDQWHYFPAAVVEVLEGGNTPCRCAVLCWTCMHEIDPDLWIDAGGWDRGGPAVLFAALPFFDHDSPTREAWETYADFAPR